MDLLNLVREKVNEAAQRFLEENERLFLSPESKIRQACITDAASVVQQILSCRAPFKSQSLYDELFAEFRRYKGDIARKIGDRLVDTSKNVVKGLYTIAKAQKLTEEWSPEEVMKRIVCKTIPYPVLEEIIINDESRKEVKRRLTDSFALQKRDSIDVPLLEGKTSGILYRLIADSFKRVLAEEWKKRYYTSPPDMT